MNTNFRPWGKLDWLLSKINDYEFNVYSCISTEDRCLETLKILQTRNSLSNHKFIEIIDPVDTDEHKKNRSKNVQELSSLLESPCIETYDLFCPINNIVTSISDFVDNSNGHIILDISSFPKRFFFPLTKLLLRLEKVNTLIITYTTPERYSTGNLSENPREWSHLPMFEVDDPDITYETALIGLGFMPLGLTNLLKDKFSETEVRLMFPFPPGPPSFQRTWNFIEELKSFPRIDHRKTIRVDALNVSDTFEMVKSLTHSGNERILMAPYGPKTMSLAMCIYACLSDSPVYYTQPAAYDSKYSEGTKDCYSYCIKLNGRNFYNI
ncbi:hypothetical protein [Pontibacter pudoricolor]|uniref:hypothetical protein n=1 Tax=Pontibacter pudoricolor TaxID=2694930 RepID=UPI00139071AC|nr:hypothetical protein [Pontibacter pudoricolor]